MLEFLQNVKGITDIKADQDLILATLPDDLSPADLNQKLSENGIYLSHLRFRKQSLESQFLELVKAQ